jgi:hypothetical protein
MMNDKGRKRNSAEEEKNSDRVVANRQAAKQCRERKRKIIEVLETSVAILTESNEKLQMENKLLKMKVKSLVVEIVRRQRQQQRSYHHGQQSVQE